MVIYYVIRRVVPAATLPLTSVAQELATPLGCEAAKYFSSHELRKKVSLQLTLACLLSCLT